MSAETLVNACLAVADGWDRSLKKTPATRVPSPENELRAWKSELDSATVPELIEAAGRLTTNEAKRDANLKAVREAMVSEIERRNAEHLAVTMHKLDKAATRLMWLSIVLTVVGLALGGLEVWHALTKPDEQRPAATASRPR